MDSYRLTTYGIYGSELEFRHGKTFREYVFGNGFCRSVITIEGNKMIHIQRGKRKIVIEREFEDEEMTMTISVGEIVARKYYRQTEDGVN